MHGTKLTAAVATGAILVALIACGNAPAGSQGKATASAPAQQTKTVQIKKSPDKYPRAEPACTRDRLRTH